MDLYRIGVLVLAITCVSPVLIPTVGFTLGFNGIGTAPCGSITQNIAGSFSSGRAHYVSSGTCTTTGSLGAPRTFPYTVKGTYANNIAEEVIEVAPPPIHQPSHPHGRWQTKYSCPVDPWLTVDGPPFGSESIRVRCQIISRVDNSPSDAYPRRYQDGKPLPTLTELFNDWRGLKPMSSWVLLPKQRQALAAKKDQDLRAEAEALAKAKADQRLRQATQPAGPHAASVVPVVLAPTPGQRFLNQTPVPIKLGPPAQWAETQIDITTGAPIKTARSVTGYLVRLERKDANGNWMPHTTLPVGAAQAESAAGYVGFGAGAPPAGITTPGTWRLSAQVSAPRQSGWSDWVEFVVMAPVTAPNSTVQRRPKLFGQ